MKLKRPLRRKTVSPVVVACDEHVVASSSGKNLAFAKAISVEPVYPESDNPEVKTAYQYAAEFLHRIIMATIDTAGGCAIADVLGLLDDKHSWENIRRIGVTKQSYHEIRTSVLERLGNISLNLKPYRPSRPSQQPNQEEHWYSWKQLVEELCVQGPVLRSDIEEFIEDIGLKGEKRGDRTWYTATSLQSARMLHPEWVKDPEAYRKSSRDFFQRSSTEGPDSDQKSTNQISETTSPKIPTKKKEKIRRVA